MKKSPAREQKYEPQVHEGTGEAEAYRQRVCVVTVSVFDCSLAVRVSMSFRETSKIEIAPGNSVPKDIPARY